MSQRSLRTDPYRNFNFLVEIQGIIQASFMDCGGLEATTEVVEYREGGDNTTVRKLPGKTSYSDITLKWGLTSSAELGHRGNPRTPARVDRRLRPRQSNRGRPLEFHRCLALEVGRARAQRQGERCGHRNPRSLARRHYEGLM